ncbi:hypothetical protein [Chenggangzhangella methanolivorans]|uniref:Uncharacterized protein n=1 Tax=Chenggangzhangella methanolivorans TaxID=1437009 RepID=A0A9E6UNA1_9HYPH|nr:hypothetical protein [Chenggangzhangella methanolivorans]QZN98279.1 hypothetical protein K6K41_14100 [Chenggangzhangella methanolivorans]
MTVIASKARKAAAALLAAAVMASAVAPAAQARSVRNAAFIAGGVAGGLLLGALAAGSADAYERGVSYERDCWLEKRKRYDAYGDAYFVKVRVCD